MMECKKALVETSGDLDAAAELMRKQGLAKADKKATRVAAEGVVMVAKAHDGHAAAMVEINCETDFVARNDKFKDLVRDVAMHIAAMPAAYLTREAVPAETVAELRAEFVKQVPDGKPPAVAEKIVEGKLNKWFEDHVVLEQSFVKDDSMTVGELVNGVSSVLGEKMSVRRFAKFALGE
jgi:elongation factor Ts